MMWCWGGFFFKCILKYLCESLQIHCFVLQNDWIVKYKIELINQFVTIIFTHKQLYNTRQCFASNLHLIYIGVKDKLFFSKKIKAVVVYFWPWEKHFTPFELQFLYLKNEVNTWWSFKSLAPWMLLFDLGWGFQTFLFHWAWDLAWEPVFKVSHVIPVWGDLSKIQAGKKRE